MWGFMHVKYTETNLKTLSERAWDRTSKLRGKR